MLASAKRNLELMSYFGLTEKQFESQFLFEETFNLEFKVAFKQYDNTESSNTRSKLSDKVVEEIKRMNHLDVELYEFARKLLGDRFQTLRSEDKHYEEHERRLKESETETLNWQDIENESWNLEDVQKAKKIFLNES